LIRNEWRFFDAAEKKLLTFAEISSSLIWLGSILREKKEVWAKSTFLLWLT